ncbi:MAG: hypothetical protein ABIE03_04185 [Patescibacteria group bacterium]|nr:hypothetical protein [Patescibacteria group bacterium]
MEDRWLHLKSRADEQIFRYLDYTKRFHTDERLSQINEILSTFDFTVSSCFVRLDSENHVVSVDFLNTEGQRFIIQRVVGKSFGDFRVILPDGEEKSFDDWNEVPSVFRSLAIEFMLLENWAVRPDLVILGEEGIQKLLTFTNTKSSLAELQKLKVFPEDFEIQRVEVKVHNSIGVQTINADVDVTLYISNQIYRIRSRDNRFEVIRPDGETQEYIKDRDAIANVLSKLCSNLAFKADIAIRFSS